MNEILKALRKARAEFPPIVKDQSNPFFKSKYAALSDIIKTVTPTLDANELTLHAYFDDADGRTVLVMDLYHDSGEKMPTSRLWVRVKKVTKVDKDGAASITEDNPQDAGSGITYAIRYCLTTYLGIPVEDDDGNRASGNTRQPSPTTQQGTQAPSQEQRKPSAGSGAEKGLEELRAAVAKATREILTASPGKSTKELRAEILGEDVELNVQDPMAMSKYLEGLKAKYLGAGGG